MATAPEIPSSFSNVPLDLLPVIHARTFQLRVVELESERLDEMQLRLRGRAEPRDVAGVRRDFRFNQDDVHAAAFAFALRRFDL